MISLLDEMILAQKKGEAKGLVSVCSAHPWVLRAVMRQHSPFLIEATCNQVNQFGGYTGMKPKDFAGFVERFVPRERAAPGWLLPNAGGILLGGDHLGPSVWRHEPAETAMQKAEELVRGYVQAGFTKIHLDTSMRLGDDPAGPLGAARCAARTARLARVAELAHVEGLPALRYVIGTEVPVPGGVQGHGARGTVTTVEGVQQTLDVTRAALRQAGVEHVWERIIAVVVQPGVEFGDDFVLDCQPKKARALARFIEPTPLVYEVHSTDYQPRTALKALVRDHFAILKVGPALTFAFREAAFALAMMENERVPYADQSHLIEVLDKVMVGQPEHWQRYYPGTAEEQAFKRKYSLSDRARYYWGLPAVQEALGKLLNNLKKRPLPFSLLSQFAPVQGARIRAGEIKNAPETIILDRIGGVLEDYLAACGE